MGGSSRRYLQVRRLGSSQSPSIASFRIVYMDVVIENRAPRERVGILRKTKAYVALTKPRVIELLLVTTVPVMILAAGGIPNL